MSYTDTVFNVTKYGATGNGSTDDSTAIQNAINAAVNATFSGIRGTVYFPNGKYYIGTGLTATTAGITFMGDGMPGVSEDLAGGCTTIIVGDGIWGLTTGSTSSTQYRGFQYENLQFYEKDSAAALGGVRQLCTGNSRFVNCAFGPFKNSIATTFNGSAGALSTLGTLSLTSTTGWLSGGGSGRIATSGTVVWHSFTYTGISGSTLTGVVYSGTQTDTVASSASVVADAGIGVLLDGTAQGDAPYNVFESCKFGTCTVGYQQRVSNGTRMVACSFDGAHNTISYTAGSTGQFILSGDTFTSVGSIHQGYDTNTFLVSSSMASITAARYEIWNTAGLILGTGIISSHIEGTFDNSLIGASHGTGITVQSGVTDALIQMHVNPGAVTTPISDSGTRTEYHIYNGTSSVGQVQNPGIINQVNYLNSPVTMTTAGTYYDGPSVTVAAGTWLIVGAAFLNAGTSTSRLWHAKLWDGTNTAITQSLFEVTGSAAAGQASLPVNAIVTPNTSTTYKISATSDANGDTFSAQAISSVGTASYLLAIKIG